MSYLKHKPGSIEELAANEATKLNDNAYQDMFKKELDKAGKGIGGMSPKEKKDFFNKIDDKYKAKNEAVNEGITSPSGQISQKNKDLLKVNNYITVKGRVYVIDKVSLKNGEYIMKAFDKNGKMHTISSKDVDSVEHWKDSLKVASYNPKNEETELEEKFALYALKDFMDTKAPGGKRKKGDRASGPMTYTQAVSKAKQMNVGSSVGGDKRVEVKPMKEDLEIKEEDAYENDRFAVSGNTAKIDNSNTPDKSNHVHAPNAKTAVAMYKAGIKSYKDTDDMRKKFPMAVEEVEVQETHSFVTNKQNEKQKKVGGEKDIVDPAPKMKFKEAYKKAKKEAMNTVGDATADQVNQRVGEGPKENDPDIKKPKAKADTGSKATPVDTTPEIDFKN